MGFFNEAGGGDPHHPQKPSSGDATTNPSPTHPTPPPKLIGFFSFQPNQPPPSAAVEFHENAKMVDVEFVKEHREEVSEYKDSILVAKKRTNPFQENENVESKRGQNEPLSEGKNPFHDNENEDVDLKLVQNQYHNQPLSERMSRFEDNDDVELEGVQIIDQHQPLCERMSPIQENHHVQLKGIQTRDSHQPLSERMRPSTLEDIVGQDHLLSSDNLIKTAIECGRLPSIILWGPPGCGKTTIAKAIVKSTKERRSYRFVSLSAVTCGVKDVIDVADEARKWKKENSIVGLFGNSGKGTILFIDEVHRFNKGQQDSLLPVIEDGTVVFIGATTQNPSFHLNTPLLSRCRVLTLNPLKPDHIAVLLRRAVSDVQKGLLCSLSLGEAAGVEAHDEAISFLSENTDGDVRVALNALEISATTAAARLGLAVGSGNGVKGNGDVEVPSAPTCINGDVELPSTPTFTNDDVKRPSASTCTITLSDVKEALQCKHIAYDRDGEEHYNQISALHKSMRGSDPDAAIYWLARMLEGGEQPLYIARRLIRFASEDVGLADPSALVRAVECYQACHSLGMPECDVILTQCVSYLSLAPKSIAVYKALQAAQKVVRESVGQNERVPIATENPDIAETQSFLPPSLQGYKFLEWPPVQGDNDNESLAIR